MNREVNKFVGYQEELAVPITDHGTREQGKNI